MRIHEIINEEIIAKDGQLEFDYNQNSDGINTKFGKRAMTPYVTKRRELHGHPAYTVYAAPTGYSTETLKGIKGKNELSVDAADYEQFLTRTAVYLVAKILSPNKTDVIVTPETSSGFVGDVLAKVQERMPHLKIVPQSFIKQTDPGTIGINTDDPRITPSIIASLQQTIIRAKKLGRFELKSVMPQHRKFIINLYKERDPAIYKILSGSNVCIFDDILTTGSTLSQIILAIKSSSEPNNIFAVTVFKLA